jgi:hypothetical protein
MRDMTGQASVLVLGTATQLKFGLSLSSAWREING